MSLSERLAATVRVLAGREARRTASVTKTAQSKGTLRAMRDAVAADPTSERYSALAEEYARQGDVGAAHKAMSRAHRAAHGELSAHQSLVGGVISARFGDLHRAEMLLSRALSLDPSSHAATYHLGSLLAQRGAFVAAMRLFRRDVPVMTGHGTSTQSRILCLEDEPVAKAVSLMPGEPHHLGGSAESADARPIYFVAADSVYFCRFAPSLLRSLRGSGVAVRLVVHIVNPDEETLRLAGELLEGSTDLMVSFEKIRLGGLDESQRKTYYSVVRYLRLPGILAAWNVPVIVADMDQLVIGNPHALLALCEISDVAVLRFDDEVHNILSVVSATAMVVTSSPAASAFCAVLADRVARALADIRRLAWHLDQAILALTVLQATNTRIGYIPPALVHLGAEAPLHEGGKGEAVLRSLSSMNPVALARLLGNESPSA